ncbi:MAG: transglycosylase SLT domain-containing protein [Methylococcaceae bacterium]|jgi:hypothetical protein
MNRKKQWLLWLILLSPIVCDAADAETHLASIRLEALSYEHGRGVKKDYHQALGLYCKAALAGDAESAYNLAFMHFYGRGVARSLPIATYWFKVAARQGDNYANKMLLHYKDVKPAEGDPDCHLQLETKIEQMPEVQAGVSPSQKVVETWVNQIAPAYEIDPKLVLAVIQAESAFSLTALSNKNAQGLMQLIPETAERFGVKDVWNPIQNIKGGMAYLSWLLQHFSGNVTYVLAAYNAGEGAVERYQGVPPYLETQNYVKRILARYPKTQHPIPGKPMIGTVASALKAS